MAAGERARVPGQATPFRISGPVRRPRPRRTLRSRPTVLRLRVVAGTIALGRGIGRSTRCSWEGASPAKAVACGDVVPRGASRSAAPRELETRCSSCTCTSRPPREDSAAYPPSVVQGCARVRTVRAATEAFRRHATVTSPTPPRARPATPALLDELIWHRASASTRAPFAAAALHLRVRRHVDRRRCAARRAMASRPDGHGRTETWRRGITRRTASCARVRRGSRRRRRRARLHARPSIDGDRYAISGLARCAT